MNMKTQGPVSGRECPQLIQITTTVKEEEILLNYEGLPTLTLPTYVSTDGKVLTVKWVIYNMGLLLYCYVLPLVTWSHRE